MSKTNHRRGDKKRKDRTHGAHPWAKRAKADARDNRRSAEQRVLKAITDGKVDPDEVIMPNKNIEVSDSWDYD